MADLVLDWGLIGAFGTTLTDTDVLGGGVSATVDTGGVAVDVTYDGISPGAQAITFNAPAYVADGETFDPQSHLKLVGEVEGFAQATSTTTLDFRSTDSALYTNSVQNVSFRLNDIDTGTTGDKTGVAGSFEDIVTITAYDAAGNPVPVTITPSGTAAVNGSTIDGETRTDDFETPEGSALVEIEGPISQIVIEYANGGESDQRILISDVEFSTVDVADNLPPSAVDDSASTDDDTPVVVDVTANDTDPEGDTLTVTSVGTPANGTAEIDPTTGEVIYTPNTGFVGTDTFTYTVNDGTPGNDSTATVTITVTDGGTPTNIPPVAMDDIVSTDPATPVVIEPLSNDTDADPADVLTVTSIGTPANGTATLDPTTGEVTYTPNAGFVGVDRISYTISDGNGGTDSAEMIVGVGVEISEGRIDTDVFPVAPGLQPFDPLDGFDEDPDPSDDLDSETGTSGADLISTGDDDDTIVAGGGADTVLPGIDDDLVDLGGGDDYLYDVQGSDTIYGGQGHDTIIAGTDTFSDYENDDPAFAPGSPLRDVFGFTSDPNQEDGRDSIDGEGGDDYIETGDDRDTITGGGGNDTIDGGIDDDLIRGNQGDDSLIGGHGSDTIDGGQGHDYIDGSNIATLELTDDIDVNTENDRDLLQGFLGNDTIFGGDDDDTLQGGSGDDYLDGGIDDDEISGGDDNDTLIGGQGNDTLNGGAGIDDIQGGSDRDVIFVDSAAHGTGDVVDGGSGGFVDVADPADAPNQDYDILNLSGVGQRDVDWRLTNVTTDSNGNGIDGTVEFLDGSGAVTGTMDFFEIEEVVPCFTPGTLIATPRGERLVEDLKVGDRVITRDNGIQEIKWVGRKDLTGHELARKPHLSPVLIKQGSLGNNLPEHDTLVSPNHRVLVANDKTALYFEEREVLVAAKHLLGLEGVEEVEVGSVSYIHIMFDQHEVVLSNGAWTESFQPGDYSLAGIGNAQRQEILELFPELAEAEGIKAYASARRSLKKHEAALLTR